MKPHSIPFILLSFALLLTSCVPIPAIPPDASPDSIDPIPDSAAETKAGFSDLASALAKTDQSDDIQSYSQILNEVTACLQADMNSAEELPEYTDSETVALSIFYGGILAMWGSFMQAFAEDGAVASETEDETSTYEFLEMALAACLEDESE